MEPLDGIICSGEVVDCAMIHIPKGNFESGVSACSVSVKSAHVGVLEVVDRIYRRTHILFAIFRYTFDVAVTYHVRHVSFDFVA